jgi:hypothetical protein
VSSARATLRSCAAKCARKSITANASDAIRLSTSLEGLGIGLWFELAVLSLRPCALRLYPNRCLARETTA